MTRKFQRTVEDFHCLQCGAQVEGDGYTNHCPHCLWSRHVDVHPGDRAEPCRGQMRPVAIEGGPAGKILHRCLKCGFERRNKIQQNDNFEMVIKISQGRF